MRWASSIAGELIPSALMWLARNYPMCDNARAGVLNQLRLRRNILRGRFRAYFSDFVRDDASKRGRDHRERSCGPAEGKSPGVLRPDRRHHRLDADYIQDTRYIVGKHV